MVGVGTDGHFRRVPEWRGTLSGPGGARTSLGGRPGASRVRRLEEIGLQGRPRLPVEGGQNPREGPRPGFRRLPGLKQLRSASARPAAPAARHAGPQGALERLWPGARAGPGAQGGRQRAGAQTRAGQAGGGRRRQRRGAVGRRAARGLLGVVVLGRAARLALFGARRARRTLGAGGTLLFAELGPAVLEPDLRAQGPVRPRPQGAGEPSVQKGPDQDYCQLSERWPLGPPLDPPHLSVHLFSSTCPFLPGLPPWDLLTRGPSVLGLGDSAFAPLITQSPAPKSFLHEAPGISTWGVQRRLRTGWGTGETFCSGSPVRADQLNLCTGFLRQTTESTLAWLSRALCLPRARDFPARGFHSCRPGEGTWRRSLAFPYSSASLGTEASPGSRSTHSASFQDSARLSLLGRLRGKSGGLNTSDLPRASGLLSPGPLAYRSCPSSPSQPPPDRALAPGPSSPPPGCTCLPLCPVAPRCRALTSHPLTRAHSRLHTQSTHLHASLREVDLERQLLARVNVGVVSFCEDALQLFELRARERGADAPLLALLMQARRLREELVGH